MYLRHQHSTAGKILSDVAFQQKKIVVIKIYSSTHFMHSTKQLELNGENKLILVSYQQLFAHAIRQSVIEMSLESTHQQHGFASREAEWLMTRIGQRIEVEKGGRQMKNGVAQGNLIVGNK